MTAGTVVRVVRDGDEVVLLAGTKEEVDAEALVVKADAAKRAEAEAKGEKEAP